MKDRPVFDCDTYSYWCDKNQYNNSDKKYGTFIDENKAYMITNPDTPRPWLNYLCNDKVASVVSNTGKGFLWYKSSLLRITKYEHPIDYLPRDFEDGRNIIIENINTGDIYNLFKDYDRIQCVHGLAETIISVSVGGLEFDFRIFVPQEDACECWILSCKNNTNKNINLRLSFSQIWSIARFSIHTAESGIPYLSTPGKKQSVEVKGKRITLHTDNPELPVELWAFFQSPEADRVFADNEFETRDDGRIFKFVNAKISCDLEIKSVNSADIHLVSGIEENLQDLNKLTEKYAKTETFEKELAGSRDYKERIINLNSCIVPDKNIQKFLNIWFKHQLFLTYRYVRSGYIGYRDSLQDTWGYELVEPHLTRDRLLTILSHMKKDGSCPRNFSPFGIEDSHDYRNFMDSATWIGLALTGYIKESGDTGILTEMVKYLDGTETDTVENHVWKALNLLFEKRGRYGLCLIGEGDWNDGIEGISKNGPAVSVWLTIATYHFQNLMAGLYDFLGDFEKAEILRGRSCVLKDCVNQHAWDGNWYIYAFSGTGNPIGSHKNKEGMIHLNSNTWAIFTGIADREKIKKINKSIDKYLETPLGPALLSPPYIKDGHEVGRIAKLEPGTFENGSVYKHAVAFKVFADVISGDYDRACRTFANILPTNPQNPDSRRTSEPYCLGNYYCGPTHERFGQNFFSWFTGSPPWLLRAGFDEILGVKADYDCLKITPKVPASWIEFTVKRTYRGTLYDISFSRAGKDKETGIWVDGNKLEDNIVMISEKEKSFVIVKF